MKKAYFTASIVGKKYYLEDYLKIISFLKKNNLIVQSDHIIKSTEDEIKMETLEKRNAFHKKLRKWISTCDFLIAEVSSVE